MQLSAADFKKLVKKLGPAGADKVSIDFGKGSLVASDNLLTIVVLDDILKSSETPVVVDARQLGSIVNRTTGKIQIETTPGELEIKSSKSEWRIGTGAIKPLVLPELKKSCKVPLEQVAAILKFASISCEVKNQFAYAGLIRLTSGRGVLTAVATNGRCMTVEAIEAAGDPFDFLIPAAAVKALASFDSQDVWIGDAGTAVFIGSGDANKSTTVIARKNSKVDFPNWESVFPSTFTFEASVSKEQLLTALDNVSPALGDGGSVGLMFEDDRLHLQAKSDGNFADDELDFTGITPDPVFDEAISFRTSLNHKQMVEFARAASEDVTFHSQGPIDPTLLTSGTKKMLIAAYKL